MKVLIFDESESNRIVANTLLSADFEVELVSRAGLDHYRRASAHNGHTILVTSWNERTQIPSSTLQQLKSLSFGLYLILLMEHGSIEQVKEGLRWGADDFIFQPQNSAEVILRVGIAERILNLQAANRESWQPNLTAPKFQSRRPATPTPG